MNTLPLSALRTEQFRACDQHFDKVALEWPDGIPLTEASARRAIELGLDINWAIVNLLTADELAAYHEACTPASAAYQEADALALAAYDEADALARAAYREACTTALAAYDEADAKALAAYREARAIELVRLLAAR